MERKLLSSSDVLKLSTVIPLWEVKDKKLFRVFTFKNFIEAFGFMTKVAIISESMCHHPEWNNVYSRLEINLTTHDLNGISTLDIELAKAIDKN